VEPALRACLAGCNAATRVQARGVSSFGCACAWGGVVGDVVARSDVHGASHWRGRRGLLEIARGGGCLLRRVLRREVSGGACWYFGVGERRSFWVERVFRQGSAM
jgi:hypothetical protein